MSKEINLLVKMYNEKYKEKWDKFVNESNNGTIFHLQQFLAYHDSNKFNFHHLIFEQDGNIIALLPGELKNGIFKSPMGASFGGFVTKHISYSKIEKIVITFLNYCKDNNINEIYLTHPVISYNKIITQDLDYALLYHGFEYKHHLYSSVINLERTYNLEHFEKKARNAVRKAQKMGVEVIINNDFDSFYPILVENKKKFKLSPTHTLEELKRLDSLLPGKIKLFLALKDDIVLGGSLIFICNDVSIIDFYIAQDYSHQQYRPINIVLFQIIRWANENGYRYFDIGVNQETSDPNPMALNRTLVSFKATFGANCLFRSTLYKKID